MKIDRAAIYKKYNGRCAYCGQEIYFNKFQVDHYWPQFLKQHRAEDNNHIDNLMPACAKCNNHKHGMRPEMWRSELTKQVARLKKNAQFDRALRFGQIQITESPIVFYFEKYNKRL